MATIYRKYRPQVFEEVYGQEHVLETLKKALKLGRVAHAYLFTGSRGVGKTTVARLLAKAVNCVGDNPPCGKCANCQAIAANSFIDLIEIDAASNRGIDEIRQLRDKIQFSPSVGKKRVYIIDEVHMLTREAFNALLKTLEEPPDHTIFIFATTESHKVPVTVMSRCQRFDFRLADPELVKKSLLEVAKKEGFKIDPKIIDLLIKASGGSFRDSQSLLDQLSAHLLDGELSYEQALEILNLSSLAEVNDFITQLKNKDAKQAIDSIARLNEKGVSFPDFLSQLILTIRQELIDKIKSDQDGTWEKRALARLMGAEGEMKFAPVESLPIELAVYDLTLSDNSKAQSAEENPVQKKEPEPLKKEPVIIQSQKAQEKPDEIFKKPEVKKSIENVKAAVKNKSDEIVPITRDIKQAVVVEITQQNKALGALLTDLSWGGDSNEVRIFAQYSFHRDKIMDKKNLVLLEKCLETVLQCKSKVACEIKKEEDIAEEIDSVFGE